MLEANTFTAQGEDFTAADIAGIGTSAAGAGIGATAVEAGLHHTAIIGNFPPRQCGLATFTRDMYVCLKDALPEAEWNVIAMNDPGNAYAYPADVTDQLPQNDIAAYIRMAEKLNGNGTQVLFVQHEFGIYGGPSGAYLLDMLDRLTMPIVTTLHTVLEKPSDEQRRVMEGLIRVSTTLVTMARKGAEVLKRVYNVPDSKIAIVPHGAPSRPLRATREFKARLGLEDKKTLMTFGLLSPNKGIETVIAAMPEILNSCPEAVYLVIGATHPHLVRHEGEKYRDGLKAMARDLGVENSVRFIDRYIGDEELIDLLQASDVYVTPYLTESQITSGTLSYAIAVGRPVVSTPYWHATEALANGVGIVCPFHDTAAFARAISGLLTSEDRREAMTRRAYMYGLSSRWSAVAEAYITRAEEDVRRESAAATEKTMTTRSFTTLRPDAHAILRMSDDTGFYQHGKYRLPDRAHGYCTDDNCRALQLLARQSLLGRLSPELSRMAYVYAGFVAHAWTGQGFRNFMSFDRKWLDDGGSHDCNARTFEALIDVVRSELPADIRTWAADLAQRTIAVSAEWTSPRSVAVVVKALSRAFGVVGNPQDIQATLRHHGRVLHDQYTRFARPDHLWLEPSLAYDNARLAEGLVIAGAFLSDAAMLQDGLAALQWLMAQQTVPVKGCFLPVPTSRFKEDGQVHPLYDQQPLEALASIEACLTAARITHEPEWHNEALRAFAWFEGDNSQGVPLVTPDGGCYDGLTPHGCNQNQGAESILAWHLGWTALKLGLPAEIPAPRATAHDKRRADA
ncbi:MAG: glycosyltransferase family 4 protein [Asticcacaulis sp.]|nr:glycosyltransferase family 4 protein [Asticcacaulis sp.]